jgi:NAD(P)-dependent dehydrogenase (short-subunit alcohol dehydrogenase family)
VGDRAQVEDLARRVGERHEAISLLVNGAGIPAGGSFLAAAPERIEGVVRVNYLGSVWCLRAFLPLLRRGVPADVVNIVSVAGTIVGPSFGPYAASKHAQLAFSRAIGAELARSGIRVHAIKPGPVPTPGFPQRQALGGRLSRHFVVGPDAVVDVILRTLARDRSEAFVPRPFALAAAAQAVAPGLLARLARRTRWGR